MTDEKKIEVQLINMHTVTELITDWNKTQTQEGLAAKSKLFPEFVGRFYDSKLSN